MIEVEQVDDMDWKHALKVGLAQCLALIPGTSRSGATIIGGLFFGLSRKAAAEFSFFLAIPTMFAATFYDLFKNRELLDWNDLTLIAAGFTAAFFSALLAVRGLLRFVENEAELAGVLGHELSHLERSHLTRPIRRAKYLEKNGGKIKINIRNSHLADY